MSDQTQAPGSSIVARHRHLPRSMGLAWLSGPAHGFAMVARPRRPSQAWLTNPGALGMRCHQAHVA
jgi:hypothetical protein